MYIFIHPYDLYTEYQVKYINRKNGKNMCDDDLLYGNLLIILDYMKNNKASRNPQMTIGRRRVCAL